MNAFAFTPSAVIDDHWFSEVFIHQPSCPLTGTNALVQRVFLPPAHENWDLYPTRKEAYCKIPRGLCSRGTPRQFSDFSEMGCPVAGLGKRDQLYSLD
ncbi:hypothetical protein TNIN_439251 [Trichonephila inaurata madagascariensis]|uniref:Uncharacterized protein n=1 Tax=Trichonephila inaurata madagascariensis TaxID=2747483 RepID=A0A8X7CMI8_9ARAC|nr:hypothetical protein TNIN_439251 [Trichonephila inaurata madagascariensis]